MIAVGIAAATLRSGAELLPLRPDARSAWPARDVRVPRARLAARPRPRRRTTPFTWAQTAGFVAEFCSLGGTIVERIWMPSGTQTRPPSSRGSRRGVDGVVLGPRSQPLLGFARDYPAPARRPLATDGRRPRAIAFGPSVVAGRRGSSARRQRSRSSSTPAAAAYAAAFTRPSPAARPPLRSSTTSPRDGGERCRRSSDVDGDLSDGELRFMAALATPPTRLADGPRSGSTRTARRSARTTSAGSQPTRGQADDPAAASSRRRADVRRLLQPSDPPPSRTTPACVKRTPPPWAR